MINNTSTDATITVTWLQLVMCPFHFFADSHASLLADADSYFFCRCRFLLIFVIILINIKLITLRYENESYYII